MRHGRSRRSPRLLVALVLGVAAAVLLGGCVQIKTASVTQPGKIGPLKVEHTICIILSTTGTACPTAPTSTIGGGAAQLLVAYRVPTWAPEPTAPDFTYGGAHLSFTRSATYEAQLASTLPSSGTRWYGYISETNPAIASGSAVQGPITTSFEVADNQTAEFSHFTVVGFRFVDAGSSSIGPANRPVVCGLNIVPSGGGGSGDTTMASCNSSWWPNTGSGDASPADNPQEIALRNRLVLAAPAGVTEITSGTSAAVRFTGKGTVAFLAVTLPLAATTTVPGATATPHAPSFSLAGTHAMPVTVTVPAGTPPGDYVAQLTAGGVSGSRSIDAPVRVVAPAPPTTGGGTTPPPGGSETPAGAPTGGSSPAGALPAGTPPSGPGSSMPLAATDLSTFDSSVAAAAATFAGANARSDLKAGKLRIKVRASSRGYVEATLKSGRKLLAKGQIAAKRKGLVTVKLKLRPDGRTALKGTSAVTGTLTVRFKPRGKAANKTSVVVTIPAS